MSWFMVDVETAGPCPGINPMIELGVVLIDENARRGNYTTFYRKLQPDIDDTLDYHTMKFMGWSEEKLWGDTNAIPAYQAIREFDRWIKEVSNGYPRFISDNNGFDYGFVSYYFWSHGLKNPFGHSSSNLGQLYKGWVNDPRKNFKHLRKTKHDHNPVNDAIGNVEALFAMIEKGFRFDL